MNWKRDLLLVSGVVGLWVGTNILLELTLQSPDLKIRQPSDGQDSVVDEEAEPEANADPSLAVPTRPGFLSQLPMPMPGLGAVSTQTAPTSVATADADVSNATDGAANDSTNHSTDDSVTDADQAAIGRDEPTLAESESAAAIAISTNQLLDLSQTSLFQSEAGELLAYNLDQICTAPQDTTNQVVNDQAVNDQVTADSNPEPVVEPVVGPAVIVYALRAADEAETLLLGSATFATPDCTTQHRYVDAEQDVDFDYKGRFQDVSSSPQIGIESCSGTVYVRSHSSTHKTLAWAIEPTANCSYSGYSARDVYRRS